jgi:hypothetical protein
VWNFASAATVVVMPWLVRAARPSDDGGAADGLDVGIDPIARTDATETRPAALANGERSSAIWTTLGTR